jgi:membrane associated rhomboid family serine protease
LLELGRTEEAAAKVDALRQAAEGGDGDPLTARVTQLAEARLAAFRGRFDETQRQLQPPPVGVPPHVLFEVLAQAASHARRAGEGELWARAYSAAPAPLRPYYEGRLHDLGVSPPVVKERRPVGTWLMVGLLAALFVLQNLLDSVAGPLATSAGRLTASQWSSAFVMGIPDVSEVDAWWRYLSYAFVHGGVLHAGLNAWVLFDIGRMYERRRHWGDLVMAFVFGTAMGSYMTSVAQAGDIVVLLGASGGVLGVAGALFADVLRSRRTSDQALSRSLLQWLLLIGVVSVAIPGVSLWGHVGGVIGGLLYGFARQGLPAQRRIPRFAGLIGTTVMAVALGNVLFMAWRLLA